MRAAGTAGTAGNTGTAALAGRILVAGGGYAGLHAARRLQSRLGRQAVSITVVDPRSYMTYQPFLAEAAAGSLEPRHVVAPLRPLLEGCTILSGRVAGIDHARREATIELQEGRPQQVEYDLLVLTVGSVTRTLPVPGLAESGIGFTTLAEAVYLRNHVLSRLDAAASTLDPRERARLLTFVVVGGGYAGVEALAELADMARYAARYYETIEADEQRWVLVEAAEQIMPEVSGDLAEYTVQQLRRDGIEVRRQTRVESMVDGHVRLTDGTEFDSDTIVWTAGVKPNPVLEQTDLPLDERGRVRTSATLQVVGVPDAFAAGDCARVPDLTADTPGAASPPTAQHAVRQARVLADNVVAYLRGRRLTAYRHRYAGSVASLGLYKGVAEIYGRKLRGPAAWFLHRTYHLGKMPTVNRKARILADWTLALPFRREVVPMGEFHHPKSEFARATGQ